MCGAGHPKHLRNSFFGTTSIRKNGFRKTRELALQLAWGLPVTSTSNLKLKMIFKKLLMDL